jgi:serine/threonine protein kinase
MVEKAPMEDSILAEALCLPASQRLDFIRQSCGGDALLVERLMFRIEGPEAGLPKSEGGDHTLLRPIETSTPEFLRAAQPGDVIGRYELIEKIGEGGCGVVFRAKQATPVTREVALKVIKLGMETKEVVTRFEAERQALALMDHLNIAKVFDAGATPAGRPFFVMELVSGERITDCCDRERLTIEARLNLFVQVCRAVQHAHQKGIIHRDLKPSNILVTKHDGQLVPKVIDFGVAKAIGQRLVEGTLVTQANQFVGTPSYMSPEQANASADIDTRSDVYSLGVLLYELLIGRTPFDGDELINAGLEGMLKIIREKEPARPSVRLSMLGSKDASALAGKRGTEALRLVHLFRGDLDWIVMKCLEKDRVLRYETANALAMDLEHHLKSEPVMARPPTTSYRVQKFIGRNRIAFGFGLVMAVTLTMGLAISTNLYLRERQARLRVNSLHEQAAAIDQRGQEAKNLWVHGNFVAAERVYREMLAMQTNVLTETHPKVVATMHDLFHLLRNEGRNSEANDLLLKIRSLQARLGERTDRQTRLALERSATSEAPTTSPLLAPPPAVLRSLWKCEGDARDSVGALHGKLIGGVRPARGVIGQALHFNGADGAVEITNAPNLQTFSIAAWIRLDSKTAAANGFQNQVFVFRKNSRSVNFEAFAIGMGLNPDQIGFGITSSNGFHSELFSRGIIAYDRFYHVVATFDGLWMQLYINGDEQGAERHPFPIDYGSRPLFFASTGETNYDVPFAGDLDEVSLYEGVLSPEQAKALYEAGRLGQ